MSRRIKIRYTIDEITNDLYTSGGEYMTVDNQEYIGLYHTYSTGEIFSLSKWNARKSRKLIPYKELSESEKQYQVLKPLIQTDYQSIKSFVLKINEKNRIDGFVDRYFLYNVVSNNIQEVSNVTYNNLEKNIIDPNLYKSVQIQWYIAGNLEDENINGVFIPGVRTKNKNEIRIASQTIRGISAYLNNLIEFYSDTTFIIPKDLNELEN